MTTILLAILSGLYVSAVQAKAADQLRTADPEILASSLSGETNLFPSSIVSEQGGWEIRGELKPDPSGRGVTLSTGNSAGLSRKVELSQAGHYVFRVMAKSDAHVGQLSVVGALDYGTEGTPFTAYYYGAFATPLGRAKAFQVYELPFVIENASEPRTVTAKLEIKRGGGTIELRSVELIRLGDTRQQHRWGQNLPADPIHGLTTLKAAANYDRPGFAAFEDTWTGAEVWLVSQGLQSRLQYPGTPNFTQDGKYFFLTSPGHVLRTDGSQRYGPFKAERNRLSLSGLAGEMDARSFAQRSRLDRLDDC